MKPHHSLMHSYIHHEILENKSKNDIFCCIQGKDNYISLFYTEDEKQTKLNFGKLTTKKKTVEAESFTISDSDDDDEKGM